MYTCINCNISQYTHTFQQMHAVFKTEMRHTLLNKCNLPFEQCSVFLQGQYPYKIWSVSAKDMTCPLKEHSLHFHMSNLLLKGPGSLLEKPIFLHKMQYYWHRASLSKVPYIWNVRFFRNVLSLLTTEHCHLFIIVTTQLSFEEIAFWETWFTCVDIYVYIYIHYSHWSAQASFTLVCRDNSHLKQCFDSYQIIYCFNQISHPYQGDVAQNNTTDPSRTTILFQKSAGYIYIYRIKCVQTMSHFVYD